MEKGSQSVDMYCVHMQVFVYLGISTMLLAILFLLQDNLHDYCDGIFLLL